MKNSSLNIGILGCRGIPNRYGGYEQFAQHLGQGLVERGHQVWVYQSALHPYQGATWKGVRLIRQPDPEDKLGTFGQFIYDFHCLRDARARAFDILLQLGYTSSAIWFPLWPAGPVNIIHMDGLEWKRTKYSMPVRYFLRWMERLAARQGDVLVADSTAIQAHLRNTHRREAEYIPYGAPLEPPSKEAHLAGFSLKAEKYYLAIARLVPENNLQPIIDGVLEGEGGLPILIVGDTQTRYGQYLEGRYEKQERVLFAGSIYEPETLHSLRRFARLYFHGHSVGGTNPSLLEAMACGVLICAHDNVFNRSVLESQAYYFKGSSDIKSLLLEGGVGKLLETSWVEVNRQKVRMDYNWEDIVDRYERLFVNLSNKKR